MKLYKRSLFIILTFLAASTQASVKTCKKILEYTAEGKVIERNYLEAQIDLENGNLNIYSHGGIPSLVLVNEISVFDQSALAVLYDKENCITNQKEFSRAAYSYTQACLSNDGYQLISNTHINTFNNEDINTEGRIIVYYTSKLVSVNRLSGGNVRNGLTKFKLSACD